MDYVRTALSILLLTGALIGGAGQLNAQPCTPNGCPAEVTMFQNTQSFPSCVSPGISCEQYVNWAIANGHVTSGAAVLLTSSMCANGSPSVMHPNNSCSSECPNAYTGPNNLCWTCDPDVYNIGLVELQLTTANIAVAQMAKFGYDHYAYRLATGGFISKIGPDPNLHVMKHGTNLACMCHGAISKIWKYVGNKISVATGAGTSFNSNTNVITMNSGTSVTASLLNVPGISYSWSTNATNISLSNANTNSVTITAINNATCVSNPTITVTYKEAGVAGAPERSQTYGIQINLQPCAIVGNYYMINGSTSQCRTMGTANPTTTYATNIAIVDCASTTLTWTKLASGGGNGTFFSSNNGKNVTVYLNTGQTIGLQVTNGSLTKTLSFYRSSFLSTPEETTEAAEAGQTAILESEISENDLPESNPSALSENDAQQSIFLYPNPATHTLQVHMPDEHLGQMLRLFDSSGRQVLSHLMNETSFTLDISSLNSGLYWVSAGEKKARFMKN